MIFQSENLPPYECVTLFKADLRTLQAHRRMGPAFIILALAVRISNNFLSTSAYNFSKSSGCLKSKATRDYHSVRAGCMNACNACSAFALFTPYTTCAGGLGNHSPQRVITILAIQNFQTCSPSFNFQQLPGPAACIACI